VQQLWNERQFEVAHRIFSPECRTHQLRSGVPAEGVPRGPAAIVRHIQEWVAAFPDIRFTIDQTFACDDRICSQLSASGTHRGAWLGIPATGKRVEIRMMTIHRVQSGKIVEDWVMVDSLGVFQQLGIIAPTTALLAAAAKSQETGKNS